MTVVTPVRPSLTVGHPTCSKRWDGRTTPPGIAGTRTAAGSMFKLGLDASELWEGGCYTHALLSSLSYGTRTRRGVRMYSILSVSTTGHCAIVQPRLYDCLMVTHWQITLKTEGPHGLPSLAGRRRTEVDPLYPGLIIMMILPSTIAATRSNHSRGVSRARSSPRTQRLDGASCGSRRFSPPVPQELRTSIKCASLRPQVRRVGSNGTTRLTRP